METTPELKKEGSKKKTETKATTKICPQCKSNSKELIKIYALTITSNSGKASVMIAVIIFFVGLSLGFDDEAIATFMCIGAIPSFFSLQHKVFCPKCSTKNLNNSDENDIL